MHINEYDVDYEDELPDDGRFVSVDLNAKAIDYFPLFKKRYSKKNAVDEWLSYYYGLYKNRSPNVEIFKRLLKRHGVWMLRNPFREGNEDFYLFHENNIFLADIDFILSQWLAKFSANKSKIQRNLKEKNNIHLKTTSNNNTTNNDNLDNDGGINNIISSLYKEIEENWLELYNNRLHELPARSVEATEIENDKEWQRKEEDWEDEAKKVLNVLFLSNTKNWDWIKEELHKDNLTILMHILYNDASSSNKPLLLDAWFGAGWLNYEQVEKFKTN